MAVINVDDIYILGETGEQVDKVTGLFTKDENTTNPEKAFAQLNIGTAGSNRNLLDNPWFTVNQRGFSSGQTGTLLPWVDRWLMNSDPSNPATLTFSDGVVTIQAPSGGFCNILQTLADPSSIVGKVVTLSVLKSDGTIISGTITRIAGTTQDAYSTGGITLRLSSTNRFAVQADSGASISIKACKLELGSVSTLANDAPPDYGTEFLKCARYFLRIKYTNNRYPRIGTGVTLSTSNAAILIPTPVPMRATTITVSYSGSFAVISVGSSGNLVSAMSYVDHTAAGVSINCTLSDSVFTPFYGCMLQGQGSANGYIDLSADL